ncbi:MAG: type I-B CRISPR-associated protein Cas8b1/Cst1 [Bacillota bacterium]
MLKLTGHPLFDVGAATIAAFSGKTDLSSVTEQDLDNIATFMERQYVLDPLKSFLTVVFPNSGFTQPAFEKQPEKRIEYAKKVLWAHKSSVSNLKEKCVFTRNFAVAIAFSDKLSLGRTARQHIPLTTGEGVINFHPYGQAGLPVSGIALLCIQAFPLGCAKCAGKLLAVHSDNEDILIYFAKEFLTKNRENLAFAQATGSSKLREFDYAQKTLLIHTLHKVIKEIRNNLENNGLFSLTAYHMSNSGQNPSLDIYNLPLEITSFISRIQNPDYKDDWQIIVNKAWRIQDQTKKAGSVKINYLYEDIFKLPDSAEEFIRLYFLRVALKWAKKDDPRGNYSSVQEAEIVSWKITSLFLREVMNLNKDRIENIRTVADKLASYVFENNDRKFFRNFFTEQKYEYFRAILLKANFYTVKQGKEPLINFEPYLDIFEEGEELAYKDWRLARDLLLIRMIEQLHYKGWFAKNLDVLTEIEEDKEATN